MAFSLKDAAPLVAGKAHWLVGSVDTATQITQADLDAFAADTSDLPTGWTNVGHTDLDDVLTFGQDGGETDVKGSWQNPSLRETVTSEAIDYFVIKSIQVIDNDVLSLYFGGGDATVAGEFSLPDAPTPTEKASTIIFLDGDVVLGLYHPKVSIRREDAIEVAADDFTKLPLRATVLQKSGAKKGKWIHADLGA